MTSTLRWFLPLCLIAAAASAASLPDYPVLDAKQTADFDRQWRKIEARGPDTTARGSYEFFLNVVAHQWRPENWAALIDSVEELHDRDPASLTYGNYRWYRREPKVNDRNALEFSMQAASLAWAAYHDRLPAEARDKLTAALTLGAEGMLRHKVNVSYTNIFLMRLANCVLVGEALNRPDLVQKGREWLDEWFAYTRQNGVHEFSSPTYYGTDLTDLGGLINLSRTPDIRAKAEAALRLFWTDIAANWFTPYQGIAGAHSRDYGFLYGHGYLDQQLLRAHWMTAAATGESHSAIDDLTFVAPPPDLLTQATSDVPRLVTQKWGPNPWERATHYVGREFTLGTAGAGYGAQDKVLTLTLAGGPKLPLVNFFLDYHHDPYGQSKMGTADGHSKLTHLMPFVASVQRGPEALLLAWYDPATARNPAGGKAPIAYQDIEATFVLPTAATLFDAEAPLASDAKITLPSDQPLFLRHGHMAAALMFVATRTDRGTTAPVTVVRDGGTTPAQRLSATLVSGTPTGPVLVAVWVRAADNITSDAEFAAFRTQALASARSAKASVAPNRIEVSISGAASPLRLVVDPTHEKRETIEGADAASEAGILVVNGRDVGGPILK